MNEIYFAELFVRGKQIENMLYAVKINVLVTWLMWLASNASKGLQIE